MTEDERSLLLALARAILPNWDTTGIDRITIRDLALKVAAPKPRE